MTVTQLRKDSKFLVSLTKGFKEIVSQILPLLELLHFFLFHGVETYLTQQNKTRRNSQKYLNIASKVK